MLLGLAQVLGEEGMVEVRVEVVRAGGAELFPLASY